VPIRRSRADTLTAVRVLVVSNMEATAEAPQRGSFVRDQVEALRTIGLDVETFDWAPGSRNHPPALRALRKVLRRGSFDVVHAHFGLSGAVAALAGADPLVVTFHGTDVRHPATGAISRLLTRRRILVAAASRALFEPEGGRPGLPRPPGRAAVLPTGVDMGRFAPMPREDARAELGLEPDGRYLLFPADPARAVKRHDLASAVAERAGARLLTLGTVPPERVPLWINAADAALITSDNEGFGLAAVEALACDVPVLSTPVGVVPFLLAGLSSCHVGPFEAGEWERRATELLDRPRRLDGGRARAEPFGSVQMAERAAAAYRDVIGG
jgi:glycosyltransferase involved in cell wall biosynthesis